MNLFCLIPFESQLIITVLLLAKISWLNKKGVQVSSRTNKSKAVKIILEPLFSLAIILWIYEICRTAFPDLSTVLPEVLTEELSSSTFLKIVGSALSFFSITAFATTLFHFKKSLRFGLFPNNRGQLITTGVFAVSRNPFFLSLELYFVGIALLIPSLFFIGFAVSAIVGIHFFILKEEKFLRENYGEEYEKYSKKVRRYF